MAKSPDDRFATMEDFATAIWPERPVHAGQPAPTVAGFAALAKLIAPRPKRRMIVAAGLMLAALGAALLLGRPQGEQTAGVREGAPQPSPPPLSSATETAQVTVDPPDTASVDSAPSPVVSPPSVDSAPAPIAPEPAPQAAPPAVRPRRPRTTPAPEATAPAPAEEPGFLTVNAVPYGSVSLDGVEIGDTPIVRRRVPPGEHTIRITRPGFRPETATVTVTAGNEVRHRRTLIKDGP